MNSESRDDTPIRKLILPCGHDALAFFRGVLSTGIVAHAQNVYDTIMCFRIRPICGHYSMKYANNYTIQNHTVAGALGGSRI